MAAVADASPLILFARALHLGLAKRHGVVPAVRPLLDRLIAQGLRLSRPLYVQILADAGESAP